MKKINVIILLACLTLIVTGCSNLDNTSNDQSEKCSTKSAEWFKNYMADKSTAPGSGTNTYVNHFFPDSGNCYAVLHFSIYSSAINMDSYTIYNPYENNNIATCPVIDLVYNKRVASLKCIDSNLNELNTPEIEYLKKTYMSY
jgi:hypothetical protein